MSKYDYPTNEDGYYYCEECDKEYETKRGYRYHMRKNHLGKTDNNLEDSDTEPMKEATQRIRQLNKDDDLSEAEQLEQMEKVVRDFNEQLNQYKNVKEAVTFEVQSNFIIVIGVSDLHYGNENVDMEFVDELLEFIAGNDRVYCYLNGDLIDNWTTLAPSGGIYKQTLAPEYQKDIIMHKLEPIKDKILAVVAGNHENRSEKAGEKNPSKIMADMLDIAYLGQGGRLNIKFGDDIVYKMHIRHKYRFNSSINPTHTCVKLIKNKDGEADIAAVGHHHEPAIASQYISGKQRSLLRFGSAMRSTEYEERIGYQKTPLVAPSVLLRGDSKQHHPFINLDVAKDYLKRQ